jgi:hypothetical protein
MLLRLIYNKTTGEPICIVKSPDDSVGITQQHPNVDVTNHPQKDKILQNPEEFKVLKSVVLEKTVKEKEDRAKATLPKLPTKSSVVGELQKQIAALQDRVVTLEKQTVVKVK